METKIQEYVRFAKENYKDIDADFNFKINRQNYYMIQIALWNLKDEINAQMQKAKSMPEINQLGLLAQEIIDLRWDLLDKAKATKNFF